MKSWFWPGRAVSVMVVVLGVLTMIPAITFADEVCGPSGTTGATVTSNNCPGAPSRGASSFPNITEGSGKATGDGGESFSLGTDIVIAGDVVIKEGGVVTDLLRFPNNKGGGNSSEAILYSVDDPHIANFTDPGFWQANHISITESPTGPTLYFAFSHVNLLLKENDYTITSSEEPTTVPEPSTLSLLGVGGVALMTRWRKRREK